MPDSETKNTKTKALSLPGLLFLVCGLLALPAASVHASGFATNFQPSRGGGSWTSTDAGACSYGGCGSNLGNNDPTPMAEDVVQIGGLLYYHVIVGDPATGFALESYSPAANGSISSSDPILPWGGFSPSGGGNEKIVIGNTSLPNASSVQNTLNSANPLTDYHVSGNGSQDPSTMAFRMVMTSANGDMSLEVSKPFLDKKPMISQTVQDGSVTSSFVTDMRGLSYTDNSTAAPVYNTLTINDPTIPAGGSADFSMEHSQQSVITAGRYTFDRPSNFGWNDPTNGWNVDNSTFVYGSYSYVGGQGFDPLNYDYTKVFDYSQNANSCTVPNGSGYERNGSGDFGGSCFNKP